MKFIIYKTTCLINGKFYIGKHKTNNINDDYLGSGLLLKKAISTYGKENFVKEILFECKTQEELDFLESQIVDYDLINDEQTYNIALGGQGGDLGKIVYDKRSLLWTKEKRKEFGNKKRLLFESTEFKEKWKKSLVNRVHSWELMSDDSKEKQRNLMSNTISELWKNNDHRNKMREIARERMKESVTDNFKYATKGRKWISNIELKIRKLVKQEDVEEYLQEGWINGKITFK